MGNVLDIPREDYLGRLDLKVMIHVIDSSRPVSLTNLFMGGENGNRVLIWDDEDSLSKYKEEKRAWEVVEVRPACYYGLLLILRCSMNQSLKTRTRTRKTMGKTANIRTKAAHNRKTEHHRISVKTQPEILLENEESWTKACASFLLSKLALCLIPKLRTE